MIPRVGKKPERALKAQPSNIVGIVHDPETNALEVTFHGGRIYRYDNVPSETVTRFRTAESRGSFLNSHIAEHHTFKRIK